MSTVTFGNLNGGAKKSEIKYMKLAEGPNVFRILPDTVLPGYTYWVRGANGKDLPFDALQYNKEKEVFDNTRPCPINDMKLLDGEGKPLRCQWSYKCRVVNKATNAVEILQLKKGMLTDIIDVAQQLEADPTDLETGFWITVSKKKTGPLPYNVEYSVQQLKCTPSPLEAEYRALLKDLKPMTELFPTETYAAQSERLMKHLRGEEKQDKAPSAPSESDKEAINELQN
jgi:hypothetical protein